MSATRQHPAFAGMRAPRVTRTFNAGADPLAVASTDGPTTEAAHKPDPFHARTYATRQALESVAAALDILPTSSD